MSTSAIRRFPTPLPVPFSKAVRAGDFLFLSGVLAMDPQTRLIEGDVQAQTRVIVDRIAATLAECGASLLDVVKATVWLADLADFNAFNVEYAKHFGAALPARSCVQAVLFQGARVEIEVMAYVTEAESRSA
jgi:2-iminobutanoate/2-iminopropanoate deaminase